MGFGHGHNGAGLDEQGQFPQRSVELVKDAVAVINVAGEIVYPLAFGEVDAVADVIALLVGCRLLVNRGDEEARTIEELIFRFLAQRVVVGVVEEHGANQGFAVDGLVGDGVGVGHQFAFEFQVPAVDGRGRFAQGLRIFLVGAPAVHVELHGGEGLPFEVTHVDRYVASAENAVHVRRDVGHTGESGADVGGDVEAYVFPIAAGLVTTPYTGVALCAGPAVKRDDERTGVVAVFRHDAGHVGDAVETERVTGADPSHVGLEYAHTGRSYLFDNVALEQGFDAILRVQVRLGPESNFDAALSGVVAQTLEVGNVAVD